MQVIRDGKDTYRQEYKYVTLWLCCVNLEDSGNRSVKIVCFGLRCVMNVHRKLTTRHCERCELAIPMRPGAFTYRKMSAHCQSTR